MAPIFLQNKCCQLLYEWGVDLFEIVCRVGKKVNRCSEEYKRLQSHSNGPDKCELHFVIVWPLLFMVIEVTHAVLIRSMELHLRQEVCFGVSM